MLLYKITDDVHWLMLTDVKYIKKSVLCAQGSFIRSTNATYEQIADLSLYIWYTDIGVPSRGKKMMLCIMLHVVILLMP